MKRTILIAIALVLLLSFAACNKAKDNPDVNDQAGQDNDNNNTVGDNQNITGTLTGIADGTYFGEGDKREYGYETANVTVAGGKITDIVLKRMNADGTEVNYDEWTGVADAAGKVKPNLKQYRTDMAKAMMDKQSADVDAISGATDSSNGWKQAVQRALDSAKTT